jgi:two-component system, NarL family, nitrate/nitrite response regulator NarL
VAELIRVLIADDHGPTRLGVRMSLEERGFSVVAEAVNGAQAVELAVEHVPDVCLLDINMPGGDGVSAVSDIRAEVPDVACVMLTASTDDEDLFAALRAGALGFLQKDMDPDRLPDALLGVLNGEAALPRALVTRLVEEFRGKGDRRIALPGRKAVDLTERELVVLQGLRDGLSTRELADSLGISPGTVRTYVHTLLKKLRVPDREAAVRLFDGTSSAAAPHARRGTRPGGSTDR